MELDRLCATDALDGLRTRAISSEELLDAVLQRVKAHNDELNLVVALDVDRARQRCREADAAAARGEWWGPLHGLPMTVKDTFETTGLVTTAGSPTLAGHVPDTDADVVAHLKGAGAIVYGKTNVPLWAADMQTDNEVYGLSRNPWDPARTTGGSSGGAAGAVAAGMTLLEVGSDIGGSIRCPAHYNGVFGHKPTWGAISARGHIPGPPGSLGPADLGVMGPLGRSVDDLELALDVLCGPDLAGVPGGRLPSARPASASLSGLRVALWAQDPAAPTSREVSGALRALADRMSDAGAHVDEAARPGPSLEETHLLYVELLTAAMGGTFGETARDRFRAMLDDESVPAFARAQARGALASHGAWLAANERRHQLMATWDRFFDRVDVVLAPCAPTVAFPHDVDRPWGQRTIDVDGTDVPYALHLVWAGLATLPLLPATAVPVGSGAGGLPIGAQVVGPRWGDRTTLAAARLIEQLTGGFTAPPLS